MTESGRPDGAGGQGRTQAEELRSLRKKLAQLERMAKERMDLKEAYQALVEHAAQGLAIIQDGRMVFANRNMETITGYTVPELEAMSPERIQALVHPADRRGVWDRHRKRLADKILLNPYEFRGIHKDGSIRWLRLYASRIVYRGRVAVQAAYVDITDSRQAELREAHIKRVLLAVRNVGKIILGETDSQRLIERACANLTETLGYSSAWIALWDESHQVVSTEAASGCGVDFKAMRTRLRQRDFPVCMNATLRNEATFVANQSRDECRNCPIASVHGQGAALARRLAHAGRIYGMLVASVPGEYVNDREHRDLFDELANDLGFALHNIEMAKALRTSEEKYRRFVETAYEGIWAMNADHETTFVNRRMASMLGYTPQQMLGHKVEDFMFEEDLPEHHRRMRARREGKGGQYERRFRRADGGEIWTLVSATAVMSPEGRFGGSFAMFTDITERKKAIEALEQSERRYRDLFEHAPIGIGLAELGGRPLAANRAMEDLLGYTAEELTHLGIAELYEHPDDRIAFLEQLQQNGCVSNYATRLKCKGGRVADVLIGTSVLQSGGRTLLQTTCIDVTEQKQVQEALRESEARYKTLIEGAPVSILVLQEGKYVYANSAGAEALGYDEPSEMVGTDPLETIDPSYHATVCERMQRAGSGECNGPMELAVLRKDGTKRWMESSSLPITLKGRPATLIVGQDITDRKKAESALKASEAQLRKAQEVAHVGSWALDLQTFSLTWSDETYRIFGLPIGQPLKEDHFLQCVHPDDFSTVRKAWLRALEGASYDIEHRILANGTMKWVREKAVLEFDAEDRPLRGIGIVQDITAQRQTEEELRQSEEKFRSLFQSMGSGCCIDEIIYENGKAIDYRILDVNPAYERIIGLPRSQAVGRLGSEVYGTGEPPLFDILTNVVETGESVSFETYFAPAGRHLQFCVSRPAEGKFSTVFADVTDRKQAEEALRNRESTLQKIFDVLPIGLWFADKEGQLLRGNPAGVAIWGAEPLVGPRDYGVFKARRLASGTEVEPEDWALAHTIREGVTVVDELLEIETFDGRKKIILNYTAPIVDPDGAIEGAIVVNQDVTDRMRAQEELAEASRRLHEAIRAGNVGLWDWALATNRVHYSPEWKHQIGYEEHEIDDRYEEWESRVHPDDLAPTLKQVRQAIAEVRQHYHVEFRFRHKDGSYRWILAQASVFCDETGRPNRVLGSHIDITERKAMERALRGEKERAQTYLDIAGVMMIALDANGNVTLANKKATEILGCEPKDVINKNWFEHFIPTSTREQVRSDFWKIMAGEIESRECYENPVCTCKGEQRTIAWHNTLHKDSGGKIVGTLSSGVDITEQKRAEEALRDSERRLQESQKIGRIGHVEFDIETGHILWADMMYDLYERDPALGPPTYEEVMALHDPEDASKLGCHVRRAAETGEPYALDLRVNLPSGRRAVHHAIGTPMRDGTSKVTRITGTVQDVTERYGMEEALRESEERLRLAHKATRDVVWDWDIVHDSQEWSPAGAVVFGWEDIVKAPQTAGWWVQRVHPEDQPRVEEEFFAVVNDPTREHWRDEYRFRKGDGSYAEVLDRGYVLRNEKGEAVRMIGTMLDITERKRAEEVLERHRAELQAIYDYAPVMMCVVDGERRVLYANRAFTEFTGICESDLKDGRACGVFGCINAQGDPRGCGFGPACQGCDLRRALDDTLKTGAGHRNIEYRATIEHNTSRRDVVLIGATAAIHTGEQTNALLCLEDRTEKEEAEHQVRQRESELLHVSRLSTLGEMASGLAHELNQPLSAILNYCTACMQLASADRADVTRIARNLERITGQAERARDIMARIRAFAQRRQPNLALIDVNQAVGGVLELLSWEIREKGIRVRREFGERLAPAQADLVQIEQVLLNLVRNAVEAMKDSPPERRWLTIRTESDDPGMLRVEVSDTGAGLPEDGAERVFDAFFTTKTDGLGIGLSISRTIVEMHGGMLKATSNPDGGSTFVIVLPRGIEQARS